MDSPGRRIGLNSRNLLMDNLPDSSLRELEMERPLGAMTERDSCIPVDIKRAAVLKTDAR